MSLSLAFAIAYLALAFAVAHHVFAFALAPGTFAFAIASLAAALAIAPALFAFAIVSLALALAIAPGALALAIAPALFAFAIAPETFALISALKVRRTFIGALILITNLSENLFKRDSVTLYHPPLVRKSDFWKVSFLLPSESWRKISFSSKISSYLNCDIVFVI